MARLRSQFFWLILVLPALIVLAGGMLFLRQLWNEAQKDELATAISETLNTTFNLNTHIGSLQINLKKGTLDANDITVLDPKSNKPLIAAKKLHFAIFTPALWGSSVYSATVDDFYLYIDRNAKGKWNFDEIIRRQRKKRPETFTLDLFFNNGRVVAHDELRPKPITTHFADVNGNVFIAGDVFRGKLSAVGSHTGKMTISGLFAEKTSALASSNFTAVQWDAIEPYVKQKPQVTLQGAVLSGSFSLRANKEPKRWKMHYLGTGEVIASKVQYIHSLNPFYNVKVKGKISDIAMQFEGSGQTTGAKVVFNGFSTRERSEKGVPWMGSINFSGSGSDIHEAWKTISEADPPPFYGSFTARGSTRGRLTGPYLVMDMQAQEARFKHLVMTNVKGRFAYQKGGPVFVPVFTGEALGGQASGSLSYLSPKPGIEPHVKIIADFKGVRLDHWPNTKKWKLGGIANGRVIAEGNPNKPSVQANLSMPNVTWRGTNLGRVLARVSLVGDKLQIPVLDITGNVGRVNVRGSADIVSETLDLKVVAGEVKLGNLPVGSFVSNNKVQGIAYFRGDLKGSFTKPRVKGNIQVYDGRLGEMNANALDADFSADVDRVRLEKAEIRRGAALVSAKGTVIYGGRTSPLLNLTLSATDIPAPEVSRLLKLKIGLGGALTVPNLTVAGTVRNPRVTGMITWGRGAQIDLIKIDSAQATFDYRNGLLNVPELFAKFNSSEVRANGLITSDKNMSFEFLAKNVPLSRFDAYLNLPSSGIPSTKNGIRLTGYADVSGTISGTMVNPKFFAEKIGLTNIALNDLPIGTGEGQLVYADHTIKASNWFITSDKTLFRLDDLSYNYDSKNLTTSAIIDNVAFDTLRSLALTFDLNLSPSAWNRFNAIGGVVSANISVNGPMSAPAMVVKVHTDDLSLRGQTIGQITFDVERQSELYNIKAINWTYGQGAVSGSGVINPNGEITAGIDIHAFNLEWLKLWDRKWSDMKGIVDVTADLSGFSSTPDLRLTVNANDISYTHYQIDAANFSLITVSEGKIATEDATLKRKGYVARISGELPFHWDSLEIPVSEPLSVKLAIKDQPLTALELLSNRVDTKRTEGLINANVDISGTLDEPRAEGAFTASGSSLALTNLNGTFNNILARIAFNHNEVRLETLRLDSSKGGSILGSGNISLVDYPNGNINLGIQLNGLSFDERKLVEQYQEPIRAKLNGGLQVVGPLNNPLVQGTLLVTNASIRLPSEFQPSSAGLALPINPRFDVNIEIGKGVELKNSVLQAKIIGDATLGGSALLPKVSSNLVIQSGDVTLPLAELKLKQDSRVSASYNAAGVGAEPQTRIDLDVQASTSAAIRSSDGTYKYYKIDLSINGPLKNEGWSNMQVSSDPAGVSIEQVRSLLIGEQAISSLVSSSSDSGAGFRDLFMDVAAGRGGRLIFKPIQDKIAFLFGLEEFYITPNRLDSLSIAVTKQLFGGVYANYNRSISATDETWQFRLFYRLPFQKGLWSRLQLGWSIDYLQINRFTLETGIRF